MDSLAAELAPLARRRAEIALALQVDSGTRRADSIFEAMRAPYVRLATDVSFNLHERLLGRDSLVELLLWPAESQRDERIARARASRHLPVLTPWPGMEDSIRAALDSGGIWAHRSEGLTYLQMSERPLVSAVSRYLTPGMREFQRFRVIEQRTPPAGDGGFMIPWDSIGQRIALLDRLITEHPDFHSAHAATQRYHWYVGAYLTGLPNSTAFARTRSLLPEPRSSYERYVARYPASQSGRLIAQYLELLRANDFFSRPPIIEFARQNGGIMRLTEPRDAE